MLLVTVPHCSESIPESLRGRLHPDVNLREIAEPGVDRIVAWPEARILKAQMHQCFGNVNRFRDDHNLHTDERYPDAIGVFPSCDFHGTPLYRMGKELTQGEREALLKAHYDPFYAQLDPLLQSGSFTHHVDAHAMNAHYTGYEGHAKDPQIRPDICISNGGDEHGELIDDGLPLTCTPASLRALAARITAKGYVCSMNVPFRGGVIMRHAAAFLPSVQLEINKRLYMTADDGKLLPDALQRLREDLGDSFRLAVV